MQHRFKSIAVLIFTFWLSAGSAFAQRITGAIQNNRRVTLGGHMNPKARPEFDIGRTDPSRELQSLTLVLKPSPSQQLDLDQLLTAQQDPTSAEYHHWLTPEEYADRFGASSEDLNKIVQWLDQQSLRVDSVARGRNWISFSGAVAQVERAFATEIHDYQENGETHYANATEPSIPQALQLVIHSIHGLNNFRLKPKSVRRGSLDNISAQPNFTSSRGNHYLSPDDFSTIYNVKPLYNAGINGAGQKLVVAGQTQINLTDVQQFRSQFNLPANDPQVLLVPNTRDPGIQSDDLGEADLDLEWSGAVAPNASLVYVYSNDVTDAVQYAIDQNLAPVLTLSYGLCETFTPNSDALTLQSWARQANAQGMTWFSASGDSGGADCVDSTSSDGGGPSVDLPAGIPEVTGVGGTEFNEGGDQFWSATNGINSGSAVSYIPEMVWNDSSTRDPAAGGGGASVYFAKPSWQTGAGVPANNARNVPDVALSASASHDGFLVYTGGSLAVFGGTSVSAPAFAGIAALLNHSLVSSGAQVNPGLGNINPKLYSLAQTAPSAFHDIVVGDNIVTVTCSPRSRNCTSGSYGTSAGPGYDQATGLGSVDAYNLVTAWTGQAPSVTRSTPTMTLRSSATSILSSGSVTLQATLTSSNGAAPLGTVTLLFGSAALGTAQLSGAGGTSNATFTVTGAQLPVGGDVLTAQYSGDNLYSAATASVTISVSSASSGPPAISGLDNGASFRQAYAPGMILTVFGSNLSPSTWSASTVPLPLQLAGVSASINGVAAPLYYVSPGQLNLQIPYEIPAAANVTLVVTNNGQTSSRSFLTSTAAPGIFTDANGAIVPSKSGAHGQVITLFITGDGAVSPTLPTGTAPPPGTPLANLPAPVQKASVTIGGSSASIQFIGIPPGLVGVTQINCQVPTDVTLGAQPVVVTIGNSPSTAATLTVTP